MHGCPTVSLVIPAYNHARYVSEAVRSVLAQDYPCLELIVIDDGSTDDTVSVLGQLGDGFHWESHSNVGQSRTLARGWARAKGEILAYLSADDVLFPGAVSASVAALMAHPEAVVAYCDFNLIDPQSRFVRKIALPEYCYRRMLETVSCPIGPGAFFRHSAYLETGPWNPNYRQMPDYDFWLRMGLRGDFLHLPQVLAGFRVHENSQTYSVTSEERAAEPVLIVSGVLNERAAKDIDGKVRNRALASAHLVSAQLHLRAGRYGATFHCVRQAFQQSARTVLAMRTLRLLLNATVNRATHRFLWTVRDIWVPRQK